MVSISLLLGLLAVASAQKVTVDGKDASEVSGYGHSHARIEATAPDFTADAVMPSGKIEKVTLSDYKGKWVVLLFYPLDFTFVCPTEIIAFSDRASELTSIDTEILAISVDSKWTHYAWTELEREKGGLGKVNIPLVSDLTREISKAYGVLLPHEGHSLRGLFIIDPEGVLRQITMNQPPVGRSFDETLRLVQAFQHHAKVGEVCPLGWKPGDDTIQEDAQGKMKFFKKHH